MKKICTLALFLTAALWGSTVDVESIAKKLEKVGMWELPATPGYVIYDPFRRAEPLIKRAKKSTRTPPQAPVVRVSAVMNDRAFVNGRWVARGDRIGPYRIVAVRAGGVVMKEGGRTLFIPVRHEKKLLKIKETER